jgi:hypothetical protein
MFKFANMIFDLKRKNFIYYEKFMYQVLPDKQRYQAKHFVESDCNPFNLELN